MTCTLISGLRTDSDDGSTMPLAKLRLGAPVEALAGSIWAGDGRDSSTFQCSRSHRPRPLGVRATTFPSRSINAAVVAYQAEGLPLLYSHRQR